MLLMSQVYHCKGGELSQQKLTYHVGEEAFLAVLGDPVVCYADASFKQTQVRRWLNEYCETRSWRLSRWCFICVNAVAHCKGIQNKTLFVSTRWFRMSCFVEVEDVCLAFWLAWKVYKFVAISVGWPAGWHVRIMGEGLMDYSLPVLFLNWRSVHRHLLNS